MPELGKRSKVKLLVIRHPSWRPFSAAGKIFEKSSRPLTLIFCSFYIKFKLPDFAISKEDIILKSL